MQQLLNHHEMWDCNPVSTPLDTSVKRASISEHEAPADFMEYPSIVGGLTFMADPTLHVQLVNYPNSSIIHYLCTCIQQNGHSIAFKEYPRLELRTILLLFDYKGIPMQSGLGIWTQGDP